MATDAAEAEDGTQPLYEIIYGLLRDHIVRRDFPSGLVLGESSVARAFNTSRVPAAAALRRLHREGLIKAHKGRGYLVGRGDARPVRLELAEAGLSLPEELLGPAKRNRRERIYPEVEHSVAACLAYGRFMLNESALADLYGVSRTIAHEVLTRLERTGLVTQDINQRWYAGPLTTDLLREHYEMRWLLEPIALGQVAPELDPADLDRRYHRAEVTGDGNPNPAALERLERDLHVDIVLRCHNRQLRETIRRSQLPVLATHSTFERQQDRSEIQTMIGEHLTVLDRLREGKPRQAMNALARHLRRSLQPNIDLLRKLGPLAEEHRPPYLVAID